MKMKPAEIQWGTYIDSKFKVRDHVNYQNIKTFSRKTTVQITMNKSLWSSQ